MEKKDDFGFGTGQRRGSGSWEGGRELGAVRRGPGYEAVEHGALGVPAGGV